MPQNPLHVTRSMVLAVLAAMLACGQATQAKPLSTGQSKVGVRPGAPRLQLWVPAYYYPNGPGLEQWERLIASAARVLIVAIVNPNSGPGDHVDTNYAAIIRRARKAGLTVVGYIGTQYTHKPLDRVEAEVDLYLRFYPEIQGIHFDEQANDAAHVGYYAKLYAYVRRRIPRAVVLGNPGTSCAPEYLTRPTCDVVCVAERPRAFADFRPPAWASRVSAAHLCVQAYGVGSAEEMRQDVQKAVRMGIGFVFITDDVGANPYSRLPSYWDEELEAVRHLNLTSTDQRVGRRPEG